MKMIKKKWRANGKAIASSRVYQLQLQSGKRTDRHSARRMDYDTLQKTLQIQNEENGYNNGMRL
ncbi:uncharacterized protein PHALS_08515 [Plasmopara halstedii]|uniref:Uncharacterized protein n=1 Tax=Plasmopara halstedii TaxID=4781 RepID=A0A0P1AD74_PLAHL|nr:uncharacterized protein PHALS_08515 [Plasmopara halstedii]CEG38439.1 hypothetical protein PHALS_08515 [Plasmopara halstedii]|eukprot:XP_024574808.1 hypothetical protein PHALS_08515 [Plasmopara halstedii]